MITNQQYTCLVEKYIDTVFRIAFNYTGSVSDAEDVTQNVFLALWRQKKPFESDDHIRHWLIRVAVNESKKLLRSPWRRHISFFLKSQQNVFSGRPYIRWDAAHSRWARPTYFTKGAILP